MMRRAGEHVGRMQAVDYVGGSVQARARGGGEALMPPIESRR